MNSDFISISKSDRIIEFITESIRNGNFQESKAIPSINSTAQKFNVAQKTVVRAYEKLKNQGLIESRPKRGYFVISKKPNNKIRVLLLIHSFEGHWEMLYNEFRDKVIDFCTIDIYFHHYNINILELVVNRNIADYDLFIISSFNHPRIKNIVGRIPAYKVLLVSRNDRLGNSYNAILQDFYQGTYDALKAATQKINKYKNLILSFQEKSGHSDTLKEGFLKYCNDFSIKHAIVNSLHNIEINRGDAFLLIDDNDLICLLNTCKSRNWKLGKDIGVISYNETPLKQVIRDGISVVSCSFVLMANEMAGFIKNQIAVQKVMPIEFIQRNSL